MALVPPTYALRVSPGALVHRLVLVLDLVPLSVIVRRRSLVWLLVWLLGLELLVAVRARRLAQQ